MDFSINRDLPQMKFSKGQEVYFEYENERKRGVIDILDFGGSLEHAYHSYDILIAEENKLYKHIPEEDVFEI